MSKSSSKIKKIGFQDSYGRSTRVSSTKKLARDLRQQFDQFQLKQQQQQNGSPNDALEEQQIEQEQQQTQNKIQESAVKDTALKHNLKKSEKSKQKQRSISKIQQSVRKITTQTVVPVPKSYLIAMEHLQDLVQTKNQQIDSLKQDLLSKQQTILDCQSRINEILNKYHSLMDMYSLKQNQVTILKQQMQQLRHDKQNALKQAARAIESQFKSYPSVEMGFSTFKPRSMSTKAMTVPRDPLNTIIQSKQLLNLESKEILQKSRQSMNQSDKVASSSLFITKTLLDPSASKSNLLNSKPKDRDYISYQRQIIRNQKQLIALKYRMECLQRKLSTNPKQQTVKQKIRTLSQQIQTKQKTINDLKKF